MEAPRTFLIIDGHAAIYRAYHAFPELNDPQGRMVNAVYGFARLLLNVVRDFQPEYVAVTFDHPKPTFRHQDFADYKAHREEMPENLQSQIPIIKEFVEVLNMPTFEIEGYEADDLVGTLAQQVQPHIQEKDELDRVVIATGDTDLLQLATETVSVFIPKRGRFGKDKLYDPEMVVEKYKVTPDRIPQLKALTGDSSDNIPGVPGVGPKTATKLLAVFATIEELYQAVENEPDKVTEVVSQKIFQSLVEHQQDAAMSLQLAIIDTNVPLEFSLEAARVNVKSYDKQAAIAFFDELAFSSLVKLLPEDEFEEGVQAALF